MLALALASGWAARERAFARERADSLKSATITLEQVKMDEFRYNGEPVGSAGGYLSGDTPASTKFITGRFVLSP